MTYRLYRLTRAGDHPATGRLLGTFADFEAALASRDADTVALFAATGLGRVLRAHHQIVGPGVLGPDTRHPVSTEVQRADTCDPSDVVETQQWLHQIRGSL